MGGCSSVPINSSAAVLVVVVSRVLIGCAAVLTLTSATSQRSLTGTYIIVNIASGRRLCSGASCGFAATAGGPLHPITADHRWRFVLQDHAAYSIVNAVNSLRILAQTGKNEEGGFLTTGDGPLYQDQKWNLWLQIDGSYVFSNVRSGRRMTARVGFEGSGGFVAVADNEPIADDQKWWLIDPDIDELGPLLQDIELAAKRVSCGTTARCAATHTEELLAQQDHVEELKKSLEKERAVTTALAREAQERLDAEIHAQQHAVYQLNQSFQHELILKATLATEAKEQLEKKISAQQLIAEQLNALLHQERIANEGLIKEAQDRLENEVNAHDRVLRLLNDSIQHERVTNARLAEEAEDARAQVAAERFACASLRGIVSKCDKEKDSLASKLQIIVAAGGLVTTSLAIMAIAIYRNRQATVSMHQLEQTDHIPVFDDVESSLEASISYGVFQADPDADDSRVVRVQCAGVEQEDVNVELIWKGCDVTIHRRASLGVDALTWKKRFQFDHPNGVFEFRQDLMMLEHGFLRLVFRVSAFQSRAVRFPQHFCLDATDADEERWDDEHECWDIDGMHEALSTASGSGSVYDSDAAVSLMDGESPRDFAACAHAWEGDVTEKDGESSPQPRRTVAVGGA